MKLNNNKIIIINNLSHRPTYFLLMHDTFKTNTNDYIMLLLKYD